MFGIGYGLMILPRKHSRHRRKPVLSWKNLALIPFIVSLVLIGNIVFCLASPIDYPAKDLGEIIPLRSIAVKLPEDSMILLISSVHFTDAPVNTKLTYEAQQNSLDEASFSIKTEYYLTSEASVIMSNITTFKFQETYDFEASLDGDMLQCEVTEIGGVKYYVIPELTLNKTNELRLFLVSFRYRTVTNSSDSARTPWLFNEKYMQYINFPLPVIEVQENATSDICEFRIHFDLPFRRVLLQRSGWMDAFVPPESIELVDPEKQLYSLQCFEYPITQNCTTIGDAYSFKTYFSKQNVANTPSLAFIPDFQIPLLLILFLSSPFYISIFVWLQELSEKRSKARNSDAKKSKTRLQGLRYVFIMLRAYSFPLVLLGVNFASLLPMVNFLFEIMEPWWLLFVFAYPAGFSIIHYWWKGRI